MKNKFNWKAYKHLAHKFIPKFAYSLTMNHGWYKCSICDVKAYIDTDSHFADKLMCWPDNLFHDNIESRIILEEFSFSCNEIIIKKIIE